MCVCSAAWLSGSSWTAPSYVGLVLQVCVCLAVSVPDQQLTDLVEPEFPMAWWVCVVVEVAEGLAP